MFFQVRSAEGYEWVFPDDGTDYRILSCLDGTPPGDLWVPVAVHRGKPHERSKGRPANLPWLGQGLVLGDPELEVLGDLLRPHGEFLPLKARDGKPLYIYNNPVVPALDEERSTIVRFPHGGIMAVEKPVLVRNRVGDANFFQVISQGTLFASQRFVDRVEQNRLKGLSFQPVASHDG